MSIQSKKEMIAGKMYKQHGTGGEGRLAEKYKQNSSGKGDLKMKYKMHGETTGHGKGQEPTQANKKGSFEAKYEMADKSGSFKGGYKQANC